MKSSRPGILIAQLGTPDAPTPAALRRYLREFLSDPRVVEMNRVLWWCILNAFILPFRPARSAALYRHVWTDKGSPLLLTTLEQARLLEARLEGKARVEVGMRYGNPSIASAIDKLADGGADRILVLPMFPQYSAATTGSVSDATGLHLRTRRVVPALRFVPPYHDHPRYIAALAATLREGLERFPEKPEKLILSFHGLPQRYVDSGDPYREHCEVTTRLLVEALGAEAPECHIAFQSRFGREEWLQPYTDRTLEALAGNGVRRVAVACPGFVADCLETTDEIGREARRLFRESGGEELWLIPCLNTHPAWIEALETICREELAGWL